MKSCKDCLHYEVCNVFNHNIPDEYRGIEQQCEAFSDRSEWAHLPCKVGDTVYFITGIHNRLIKSAVVLEINIDESGINYLYVKEENTYCFEHSFDTFYLTREEAERTLKERKINDT